MPRADSERQQNNKSTAVHPLSCRFTFANIYILAEVCIQQNSKHKKKFRHFDTIEFFVWLLR